MKSNNSNIIKVDGYIEYVVREVKIDCPNCGRCIEGLVAISLDNCSKPFIKRVKVCRCGYVPTIDDVLEALDEQG